MKIETAKKTAVLFGSTGLIGGFCLEQLLESPTYSKVKVFNRRKLPLEHPKLEQYLINFDELKEYADWIKGDDVFCCLGTTRRKAGSKEAFSKVDYTYVFEVARIASKNKVNQFLLVSSTGADPDSVFFYSEVKGKIEQAIEGLDFWAVRIFRPSILTGPRQESRLGESIGIKLMKGLSAVTGNLMSRLKPIEAEQVAKAMIRSAQSMSGGVHIYESEEIQTM